MEVLDIAYYVVNQAKEKQICVDSKKLQKLLYYIQGYFLKEYRVPAFEDEFEHWKDGPVIRKVYLTRRYNEKFFNSDKNIIITNSLKKIVDDVLECSRDLSSNELIKMTHSEDPWRNHNKYNEKIPNKDILEYFDRNDPLSYIDYKSKHHLTHTEKKEIYEKLLTKRSKLYKEYIFLLY